MNAKQRIVALSAVLLTIAGCTTSIDSKRSVLKGKVTFNGQPVPTGSICFDPDTAKGNSGPQGVGQIRDGKYRTNADFGTVGGPHVVRIAGFDGKPTPGNEGVMTPGKPLFLDYVVRIDIPKGKAELDFDVPSHPATANPQPSAPRNQP